MRECFIASKYILILMYFNVTNVTKFVFTLAPGTQEVDILHLYTSLYLLHTIEVPKMLSVPYLYLHLWIFAKYALLPLYLRLPIPMTIYLQIAVPVPLYLRLLIPVPLYLRLPIPKLLYLQITVPVPQYLRRPFPVSLFLQIPIPVPLYLWLPTSIPL
jgi:hypothetical protein